MISNTTYANVDVNAGSSMKCNAKKVHEDNIDELEDMDDDYDRLNFEVLIRR